MSKPFFYRFIFSFVIVFSMFNLVSIADTTDVQQDENIETVWMRGKVISKSFVNKVGKEFPDISEFYFRHFYKNYFIKMSESEQNVVLSEYYDDFARVNCEIREGLWDGDDPNAQSRVGEYLAIFHIEKIVPPQQITYTDANNNQYFIDSGFIKFRPVSKEDSSSGTYSGGEPEDIEIDMEDFMNIYFLVENAFINQQLHLIKRIKTSSIITIEFEDEELRAIIIDSREIQEIEGFLEKFFQQ